ncbi:MAG: hypothetical protein LBR69_01615 [Endomicrobium sp.]|jgi:hypothetical protein|nr:hypothetical protein [Endomicrobium sp.]
MKNFLTRISIVSVLAICACSDKIINPVIPPAPKPNNNYDIAAVAVKKADYYVRLVFDLGDGYLSDDNVAKLRYGGDSKYVESLDFSKAEIPGVGIIHSRALGSFDFYYEGRTAADNPALQRIYEYTLSGYTSNTLKRRSVVDTAMKGELTGARVMHIDFFNTDIYAEALSFSLVYTESGYDTSKGASMSGTISFGVIDSSNTYNAFDVTYNLSGRLKFAGAHEAEGYVAGTKYNFIVEGTMEVKGKTGELAGYVISLNYSNDTGSGQFTVNSEPYAAFTVTKRDAYYENAGQIHVLWDYPL